MTADAEQIDAFIAEWAATGGSELANTQSFVNGLCALIGVDPPRGSRADDVHNDYVFERRVFQKEADGSESFGRIDAYKRDCFVLEAKQGSDADRAAAEKGEADLDIFGQTTILPWPKTLPEQVSAVAALLGGAAAPMSPREVAAAFKGKRAATV